MDTPNYILVINSNGSAAIAKKIAAVDPGGKDVYRVCMPDVGHNKTLALEVVSSLNQKENPTEIGNERLHTANKASAM